MFKYIKIYQFLPLVILALFTGVAFRQYFFAGKLPIPADTIVGLYHPWRDFYSSTYPAGIPFKNFLITDPVRQQYVWRELGTKWNPYESLGTPLLANIQAAKFYPLNFIYRLVPSFATGWSIQVVLQIVLGGSLMFFYLRSLNLLPAAQALGVLAWVGSGFFVAWLEWNTLVQVAIWLPLALLAVDKRWWFLLSLSLVTSFFAGHAQIFLYVFIVTVGYAFYKRCVGQGFIASLAVTVFLTLPQWLPMATLLGNGVRSIGPNDWQNPDWFLPWQNLVQLVAPDYFGNPATLNYFGVWNYGEFVGYVGILPLFFTLFGSKRRNFFWVAILSISLLFALPNPISKLLPQPFQPSRLLVLVDFSLAVLAAYGLDNFLQKKSTLGWRLFLLPTILVVLVFVAWKMGWLVSLKNLIFPAAILTFGLVSLKIPRLTISLVLLLTVFDLSRFFTKFESFSDALYIFPSTKVISFLQEKSKDDIFRVASLDDRILPANFASHYKIQTVSGYDSWYLRNYTNFVKSNSRIISPKDLTILDQANVKYLLTFDDLPAPKYQLVFQEGQTKVYESKAYLSRVSISSGSATIKKYSEDEVIVETQSQFLSQLVLRDAFYPDWKISIDGQRGEIKLVDAIFRGVLVPPGNHLVRFQI